MGRDRIPPLIELVSRLRQTLKREPEKNRIQEFFLEQLTYSMASAAMALVTLVETQTIAPRSIPDFPREPNGVGVVLLPEHVKNLMGFSIDNYYDSARRVQNAVNTYINKVLRLSVPSSMASLVKDVENNRLVLPDNINTIIIRYWQKDGR
jgi:hypothetical protein